MAGVERITKPLLDVLEAFLDAAARNDPELHGWAIMRAVHRSGPTVYGVIDRLEDAGWITGRWEEHNPEPNRPPRRLYHLTGKGEAAARDLLTRRRPTIAPRGAKPSQALGWA